MYSVYITEVAHTCMQIYWHLGGGGGGRWGGIISGSIYM